MKIALLTTLWARPAVERAMLQHHLDLFSRMALRADAIGRVEWCIVVASSPPWTSEYGEVLGDPRVHHVATANRPLGRKHNTALAQVPTDATHVLVMGSDDFADEPLLAGLAWRALRGAMHVGVLDCYFVDRIARTAVHWHGYHRGPRAGEVLGAGRLIEHRMITAAKWPDGLERGLDAGLRRNLQKLRFPEAQGLTMAELGGHLLCSKGPVNLWSASAYKGTPIDFDSLCLAARVELPKE